MAITPDTVISSTLGDMRLIIGIFSTAGVIDDNETWATGIKSIISYWTEQTTEGPNDLAIDDETDGVLTFSTKADNTGIVYILCRGN